MIVLHSDLLPMAVVGEQTVVQTNVQPIQRGRQEVFHRMAIGYLVQMPLPRKVVMEVAQMGSVMLLLVVEAVPVEMVEMLLVQGPGA